MDCSCQTPLSMVFPGQEHYNGVPLPSPGIDPVSCIGRATREALTKFVCVCVCVCARVCACSIMFDSLWPHQAPISMEFSRQENWSELLFPTPRDLPNPGTEPLPPVYFALAGTFLTIVPPGKLNQITSQQKFPSSHRKQVARYNLKNHLQRSLDRFGKYCYWTYWIKVKQ